MKRIFLSFALLATAIGASAQVAVTVTNPSNSTPALAGSYSSLSDAITALSAVTAFSGPVTLTCTNGTETAPPGGYDINFAATTSATNNVIIDGGGSTITASNAHTSGALTDAIFKITGSDFVTLQHFTMQENAANTITTISPSNTNNMTEWGVALLYASATNGAQNNTIQNNTISLNRTYQNTFGIYSNSTHTATSATASATATSGTGGNSGLKVYANNISNVNNGICVVGPTAAADLNTGIDIGGINAATGNTISNYGTTGTFSGFANVSASVNGILVRNSKGFNIANNSITSSAGATGVSAGALYGIQIPTGSAAGTGTFTNNINNNVISLTTNLVSGGIVGINVGSATGSTACTFNINGNNFTNISYTPAAATGAATLISYANGATALATSISSNTFSNLSVNTSGSVTFISRSGNMPSESSELVNNNSIVGNFIKTIAGGTVTCYTANSSSVAGSSMEKSGNNFSKITLTGATAFVGFSNTEGASSTNGPTNTIINNTFSNINAGAGQVNVIGCGYSPSSAINNNTIADVTSSGGILGINAQSMLSGNVSISGNTITNLNSAAQINVIQTGSTTTAPSNVTFNITSNKIAGVATAGAANPIYVILNSSASTSTNVINNVSQNNISNIVSDNAGGSVTGIATQGTGHTFNCYNNVISDLRTPSSSGTSPVTGIYCNVANANLYYNTIALGKAATLNSTGANFGTTGIQYTTGNNTLKNNIVWIDATPSGTGTVAAVRRSAAGTAGTAPTATNFNANNNIYNIQNPGVNKYLYLEGTTVGAVKNGYGINIGIADDATNNLKNDVGFNTSCGLYKTFMGSRENGTFSEDNLTASGAPDFTFVPSGTSYAESAAVTINSPAITNDYNSVARSATPDIGALEFTGTGIDGTPPSISFTNLSNTPCTTGPTLNVTITDVSGISTVSGSMPRIYFRKAGPTADADAFLNYPAENTNAFNGWKYVEATGTAPNFSFTLDYNLLTSPVADGDSIAYFVMAQDINGNVAKNAIAFPAGFCPASVNLPSVGATPTSASLGYKISTATASYITTADGEWNNSATWTCGLIPPASATNVVIAHNITVSNTGNIGGSVTVNSGASLMVKASGMLTLGNNGGDKISLNNNGTLQVEEGGTLKVNGNVSINAGATFNQSGGDIFIDGNANGVTANSSSAILMEVKSNLGTVTGGNITFVDPPAANGIGTLTFNISASLSNLSWGRNHHVILGDGVSTDASANTLGFMIDTYVGNGVCKIGSLTANGGSGTNRFGRSTSIAGDYTIMNGDLAINANSSYRILTLSGTYTFVGGNIINNGILVNTGGLAFLKVDGSAVIPATEAQTIGGSGVFNNALTGATASFATFEMYNSNPSGVTLQVPISISGTFFLDDGILNTTATNLLTIGTGSTATGTITRATTPVTGWINGPVKKWFAAATGSTTLPLGNTSLYEPATINFTTAPTSGTLTASFNSAQPDFPNASSLTESTLVIDKVSSMGYWSIDAGNNLTGGTYTATFTGNGANDVIDYTKTVLLKRPSAGGDWTLNGTHVTTTGSNTAPVLSRTGMTGFSQFAIGGQKNVALPISIVYFRGSKQDKANVLDWKVNCTQSINMELEKSADSRNFKTIYTESATSDRCEQGFSFVDNDPLPGVNYYRLKTTDPGGMVKYSTIVSLYNNKGSFELVNVVPNPVISSATLVFNAANEGNTSIVVTDAAGRVVLKQMARINTGETYINMDLTRLAKGVYHIAATDENGMSQTVRFVKE